MPCTARFYNPLKLTVDSDRLIIKENGKTITTGNLYISQIGFSRRAWIIPHDDHYKNNGRGTFMAGDSANLYGLRYDSDTFFNVGIVQGLVPAGYYLTYRNSDKTCLGFGYYAYGNNKGSATAYSAELITMSSFGSRNKTMDILLSRL